MTEAPPQTFIGPKLFPDKVLPCNYCSTPVVIPAKYRMSKGAVCSECSPIRRQGQQSHK